MIVKWEAGNDDNLNVVGHIQSNCVNLHDIPEKES